MPSASVASKPCARGTTLTPAQLVLLLIGIGTLLRFGLAATTGLVEDESYTTVVSRHFDWSYFDHPPIHVWLVGATAKLFHSEATFVLRLPFILLFAGSTWLMFRLTALTFGERAGVWAALVLNLAPEFAVTTASWVLPDGPLIFFLLGAGYAVRRLLATTALMHPLRWWLAAGALGGAAMLSKYSAAFFFAGMLLFLVTVPAMRRHLATPGPWAGGLLAAVMFLPVLMWNAQHDWISFGFQGGRAMPREFSVVTAFIYLGGQLAYLGAWIAVLLVVVLWRALRAGPAEPRRWLFACLAIGPVAVFTIASFFTRVLPHWPLPGWLFAFPLLGEAIIRWEPKWQRVARGIAIISAILLVAFAAIVATQASTGWLSRWRPGWFAKGDISISLYDWSQLRGELIRRDLIKDADFVAGANWITCGKLGYALGPDTTVLCIARNPHQFALSDNAKVLAGHNGLIIGPLDELQRSRERLGKRFEHLEEVPPITLTRGGAPVVTIGILRAKGLMIVP